MRILAASRGRLLVELHDILEARGRPEWFGIDLLHAQQAAYQGMVQHSSGDRELLDQLLRRIRELQQRVGFGQFGWRFRLLAACLGYARAERLRAAIVRWFRRRPKD